MLATDAALMRTQEPALEERRDPVDARQDRVGLEFRIRSLNRGLGHHCVAPEF